MSDTKSSTKLIILMTTVLIVCLAGALWFRSVNTMPVVSIPTRTLPSPNAFDYYVDAGKKLTHANDIGFAIDDYSRPQPSGSVRPFSLAEKEVMVRDNAQALSTLRQGFSYQCVNPPCRSFETLFPYMPTWRNLSRLLVVEAQVKESKGDWGGALNSCLDAIYFGEEIPRGGTMIHSLTGGALQSTGRREGWKTIDHLSASEAKAAARRMQEIISRQVPYAEVMEQEKWYGVASLSEMMVKPGWYSQYCGAGSTGSGISASNMLLNLRGLTICKGKVIRNYAAYMDQIIANARKPYGAKPPPPPVPKDPICQIICPIFVNVRFAHVSRIETQNALFAAALALRAYRAEHGVYPRVLAELVPSHLSKLPDDPFAAKGPLRYKRSGNNYVLYSVGPDGVDDGGIAMLNPLSKPTDDAIRRHMVQPKSTGDIVAGVNQ